MTIELATPAVDELGEVVRVLREWQVPGGPHQLHPGDIGWYWRFGAERVAGAVRTWSRDGRVLAVGLLDDPELLRMAFAADAFDDEELAQQVREDVSDPARGVLVPGKAYLEAPNGTVVRDLLMKAGWTEDDPWQPVVRDLTDPVEDSGVRIEVVGPDLAAARTSVQRAAFDGSTFTLERWHAMAEGIPYQDARCLLAFNEDDVPVAAITVWSAGAGRPGHIEPMGVHRDHRGNGYGRAITLAGAAALRDLGATSAGTYTPGTNVGAIATYESAGLLSQPQTRDLIRPT